MGGYHEPYHVSRAVSRGGTGPGRMHRGCGPRLACNGPLEVTVSVTQIVAAALDLAEGYCGTLGGLGWWCGILLCQP